MKKMPLVPGILCASLFAIIMTIWFSGTHGVTIYTDVIETDMSNLIITRIPASRLPRVKALIEEAKRDSKRWEELDSFAREAEDYAVLKKRGRQYVVRVKPGDYFVFSLSKGYGYFCLVKVDSDFATELDQSWRIDGK